MRDYKPRPVDTSDVVLPEELRPLCEHLARNVHELWARRRIEEGWKYGDVHDGGNRTHPGLVDYNTLPDSEKEYDRLTSEETIKLILKLGFVIVKV